MGSSIVKSLGIATRKIRGRLNLDLLNTFVWWQGYEEWKFKLRELQRYQDKPYYLVLNCGANNVGQIPLIFLRIIPWISSYWYFIVIQTCTFYVCVLFCKSMLQLWMWIVSAHQSNSRGDIMMLCSSRNGGVFVAPQHQWMSAYLSICSHCTYHGYMTLYISQWTFHWTLEHCIFVLVICIV